MTELEAVNVLLSIIGEAPIDRLADTTQNEITDSALARRTLAEVSRDVQSEGWSWNTDVGVTLAADSNKQFLLSSDVLAAVFSPNRYPDGRYVARGNRVWDRVKRTYAFADDLPSGLIVDRVVTLLPWEELPHQAQQYVVIRSGRIYADRYINSNAIYVYTVQDEEYARTMLIRSEEQLLNNNMLWGNDRGVDHGVGYAPVEGLRYRSF